MLTRELAREGRLTELAIDIVDRPGQLALVSNLLGEAGANIIEVSHQRTFSDLPAKAALLLPDLEGLDTAERQLLAACHKAGINPAKEKITAYRFQTEKYASKEKIQKKHKK